MLAGCMSSPTYGTDKTANEQLIGDVSGILSLAPKNKNQIEYKPRPELVKPTKGEVANLPDPQEDITRTASAAWPESPEQRRARLRAEATANQGNSSYDSPIVNDTSPRRPRRRRPRPAGPLPAAGDFAEEGKSAQQRAEFNKRLAENKQGSPTSRKYLSEPPLRLSRSGRHRARRRTRRGREEERAPPEAHGAQEGRWRLARSGAVALTALACPRRGARKKPFSSADASVSPMPA